MGYVCVTGVHGVMEAQRDPALRRILNSALANVPDGMPMVWVARGQGHASIERVYGPDLMLALCERSLQRGYRHFLYGGRPGVVDELAQRLRARFPSLQIVGTFTPPFRPLSSDEEQDLAACVTQARPDLFWVGLSTPKQERFMAQYSGRLRVPVMLGVGAAFDMHSGGARRAPPWMQQRGLEWLFRLAQEPRRLFWRYARNNPAFVSSLLLQLCGLRKYSLDDEVPARI
jgi:N-acetylglucosaminyldiphosphoundecaprenol N-acetyl-beta-D-mannosaminyltransferase